MTLVSASITTPWQPLSVIVDVTGQPVVVAAAFQPVAELVAKAGLDDERITTKKDLGGVTATVSSWIDGDVDAFDELEVRQDGGEFMQECWTALRTVRGGTVVSYGQLASLAGRPLASRAAGSACASNLIAPFIPCHRVVRAGGDLGNYGFGVPLKRALLLHEGVEL
jgi:methylated-DNA-[protein]-cysteine S-methyltransferase